MLFKQIKIWFMAIRPQSLIASASPVIIGTAMAFGDGVHHFPSACICLIAAFFIHIGTNLTNEYCDFKKGADQEKFLGSTGVSQVDLIKTGKMKKAIILIFGLTLLFCIPLVTRGGWPIVIIYIFSILSAIFYTAGPRPLGYMGLGELLVFIFFGPVAVSGTYYVQSLEINTAVALAGIAPGLISAGILLINNIRDIENDRKAGKMTVAVILGKAFSQLAYIYCIILASLVPVFIYIFIHDHIAILICSMIPLVAAPNIMAILTRNGRKPLNLALAFTGKMLAIYTILFSIAWIV